MKISWIVVIAASVMISAIILAIGYAKYDPTNKEIDSWVNYTQQLQQVYNQKQKAIEREKDAEAKAKKAIDDWNAIAAVHTLPGNLDQGGIDLSMNSWRLAIVLPTFRNSLQKMVNAQVVQGGVKVITGPTVPAPPSDPNKVLATYFNYPVLPPVVIFDLGTITVEGTYQQISDNMKAWARMPHFMAVSDGLRLQGTAPKLTGTYQVSIVGFIQLPDPTHPGKYPIYPPVPEGGRVMAGAPAGGAAGAGAARVPGRGGKP